MKFDMGQAWNDAAALLANNRNLVLIVAAVFFFLPYFAMMLFLPAEIAALQNPQPGTDPGAMMNQMRDFYASSWWIFVLIALAQAVGVIGLLILLTDKSRPTLGDALSTAVKFLPTYIGVQLLQGLIFALVMIIPIAIGAATGSVAIGIILGIAVFVAAVYLFTKFSLTTPTIAIERTGNPITALQRSWALTKGNSLRVFLFYFLIFVVFMVLSAIVGMIGGLIFAFMGTQAALIGNGFISGVINAGFAAIFAAVLAATHGQLSGMGAGAESVSDTFE